MATSPSAGGFSGYVNFRDYSTDNPPGGFAWSLAITAGSPTPTAIVIADRRDGSVLANVPIQQATGMISGSGLDLLVKADRNRAFEVLTSGKWCAHCDAAEPDFAGEHSVARKGSRELASWQLLLDAAQPS